MTSTQALIVDTLERNGYEGRMADTGDIILLFGYGLGAPGDRDLNRVTQVFPDGAVAIHHLNDNGRITTATAEEIRELLV